MRLSARCPTIRTCRDGPIGPPDADVRGADALAPAHDDLVHPIVRRARDLQRGVAALLRDIEAVAARSAAGRLVTRCGLGRRAVYVVRARRDR
jgi:hypothetical protein